MTGSFRNSCDVFDRVEYFCGSRLQMSSYPVPVTSTYKFSCQIGQAFTSFLSLANQRSCDQSDFPPQGELSSHSCLRALSSLWYLFLSLANNSPSTSKLIGFRQPQRIFHFFHSSKSKIEILQDSRTSTFLPRYCGLKYGDQIWEAK